MFFFKQKTAYEMRISDWSSDVCSSDLAGPDRPSRRRPSSDRSDTNSCWMSCPYTGWESPRTARNGSRPSVRTARYRSARSEEHTSELQSLMRISYAVFCLKKKKHIDRYNKTHTRLINQHQSATTIYNSTQITNT